MFNLITHVLMSDRKLAVIPKCCSSFVPTKRPAIRTRTWWRFQETCAAGAPAFNNNSGPYLAYSVYTTYVVVIIYSRIFFGAFQTWTSLNVRDNSFTFDMSKMADFLGITMLCFAVIPWNHLYDQRGFTLSIEANPLPRRHRLMLTNFDVRKLQAAIATSSSNVFLSNVTTRFLLLRLFARVTFLYWAEILPFVLPHNPHSGRSTRFVLNWDWLEEKTKKAQPRRIQNGSVSGGHKIHFFSTNFVLPTNYIWAI